MPGFPSDLARLLFLSLLGSHRLHLPASDRSRVRTCHVRHPLLPHLFLSGRDAGIILNHPRVTPRCNQGPEWNTKLVCKTERLGLNVVNSQIKPPFFAPLPSPMIYTPTRYRCTLHHKPLSHLYRQPNPD